MWFKQVTCDSCFDVMPKITRQNKYYGADIIEVRILDSDLLNNKIERKHDDSLVLFLKTKSRSYKIIIGSFYPDRLVGTFCSIKCALNASKRYNKAFMYFDEHTMMVSLIIPILAEFNNNPIAIPEWPEWEWFCKPYERFDFHSYGTDKTFPEFVFDGIKLLFPSKHSTMSVFNMMSTRNFMIMYFGGYDAEVAEDMKRIALSGTENELERYKREFGARLTIEWHISDYNNNCIGFIHITKLYQGLPNAWVIEFGLLPSYEHKGIMSKSINKVLDWAKKQGCEDIYAFCQADNIKSHAIFRRLNYDIELIRQIRPIPRVGFRELYIFHIRL